MPLGSSHPQQSFATVQLVNMGSCCAAPRDKDGEAPVKDAPSQADSSPAAKQSSPLLRFHSAVRWGKPWSEIKDAAGNDMQALCKESDPKNGNTVLHIAAQNGHLEIMPQLVAAGALVNVQNGKGQTPLHMSIAYDFYFVSKFLLDSGANGAIVNEAGNKAIEGMEGDKKGADAYDNPVFILSAAKTKEELEAAFVALEKALATPGLVNKEQLIQVGCQRKKKDPDLKAIWDHKRFMDLAKQF
jgi:hypothetical protein